MNNLIKNQLKLLVINKALMMVDLLEKLMESIHVINIKMAIIVEINNCLFI